MTLNVAQALESGRAAMKVEAFLTALAFRIIEVGVQRPRVLSDPVEISCACECVCDRPIYWILAGTLALSLTGNLAQFCLRRAVSTPPDGSPARRTRGVTIMPARRPPA